MKQQIPQKTIFSSKQWDFIYTNSRIDVMEGTARSGKTSIGRFKFGLRVKESSCTQHMIAASTSVVARRNIVDCDFGFKEMFGDVVDDGKDPKKGNYLTFIDSKGRKKYIYIVGFKDKARWKDILGSTVGCILIDEINLADKDFIAQAYRSGASVKDWYLCATLNPANPDLEIYDTFINRTRPLKKYIKQIPTETLDFLKKCPNKPITGAAYWFFNFNDNPVMTEDLVSFFKEMYPVDSFYYNSLVLGLRGVTEGVVFGKYITDQLDIELKDTLDHSWQDDYIRFAIGIDLGNNEIKRGTVLTFTGVMRKYAALTVIDSFECSSTEANALVLEIALKIYEWYYSIRSAKKFTGVYIDGYGAIELLIPTIRKKVYEMGISKFLPIELAIKFGEDGGRKARLLLFMLLINQKRLRFNKTSGAQKTKLMFKKLVYNEDDGLPLDNNQIEMDYYDSCGYATTPFLTQFNEALLPEHYKPKW